MACGLRGISIEIAAAHKSLKWLADTPYEVVGLFVAECLSYTVGIGSHRNFQQQKIFFEVVFLERNKIVKLSSKYIDIALTYNTEKYVAECI